MTKIILKADIFCPHLEFLRQKFQCGKLIIQSIQFPAEHTLIVILYLLQRLNFQHPAFHNRWTLATGLDEVVRPLLLGSPLDGRRQIYYNGENDFEVICVVQYRALRPDELCRDLFDGFIRRQVVTRCWRREKGAKKLYISAHSAVESQAFYQRMGCVKALEYNRCHVDADPFDCQLECVL